MALSIEELGGPLAKAALLRPELDWACGTSWDGSLLAVQHYLDDIQGMLDLAKDPLARGFLALEFRCAVVELVEYVGGIAVAVRFPPALSHGTDGRALVGEFEALRAGVSHEQAAALLYMPETPPMIGDSSVNEKVSRAYGHILENVASCLKDVGTYWLDHIEATRWYRHCPAFLSLDDTYRIEPAENQQRDEVRRQQQALSDVLFTFVRLDDRIFNHEVIRRDDVAMARHVMRMALAIIVTSFGNRVLDPTSPHPEHRLRKFPRLLTGGVTSDDLVLLRSHGQLFIPD